MLQLKCQPGASAKAEVPAWGFNYSIEKALPMPVTDEINKSLGPFVDIDFTTAGNHTHQQIWYDAPVQSIKSFSRPNPDAIANR
jgi:hypothetical protein